jgi:chromosome segregation ATPase
MELANTLADWQAGHVVVDPVIRCELDLARAALEERLESQARTMLMLDQALHQGREAAMSDREKLSAMEAEVPGPQSLLGETEASVQKTAQDVDLVRAAAAEQLAAHGRNIRALEDEMARVSEATADIGRSLTHHESEWKAAIGDLQKKANQGGSEVSGVKEMLGNLESKQATLREIVVRQGDELAETRRQNSELGGRVQRLEEENGLIGNRANG